MGNGLCPACRMIGSAHHGDWWDAAREIHDRHSKPNRRGVCEIVSVELAEEIGGRAVYGAYGAVMHCWVELDGHVIDATRDQWYGDEEWLLIHEGLPDGYVEFTQLQIEYMRRAFTSGHSAPGYFTLMNVTTEADLERLDEEIDHMHKEMMSSNSRFLEGWI